jgi:hypothetical protein
MPSSYREVVTESKSSIRQDRFGDERGQMRVIEPTEIIPPGGRPRWQPDWRPRLSGVLVSRMVAFMVDFLAIGFLVWFYGGTFIVFHFFVGIDASETGDILCGKDLLCFF